MGLTHPKNIIQQQSLISINDFYGLRQSHEPLYQSTITSKSRTKNIIRKIIPFTEGSDNIITFLKRLQKIGRHIECQNLYLPVQCQVLEQAHICSQLRQIEVIAKLCADLLLSDEIIARRNYNEGFAEEQIWYILYSLLNACRKFEPLGIKTGNLKTEHVLLNERGHLKIINQLTYPQNQNKHTLLPNYYSPEQLLKMAGVRSIRVDPNISQTFSIAIIMLELCTFMDGDSFYDPYRFKLNEQLLARADHILSLRYSKLLHNLTNIMMTDYSDRPLPSQIYMAFKPYQQDILALRPFQFNADKFYQSLYQSKADYLQ